MSGFNVLDKDLEKNTILLIDDQSIEGVQNKKCAFIKSFLRQPVYDKFFALNYSIVNTLSTPIIYEYVAFIAITSGDVTVSAIN